MNAKCVPKSTGSGVQKKFLRKFFSTALRPNVVVSLIGGLPIETISLTELNRPGKVSTDNCLLDHGCVFSHASNHLSILTDISFFTVMDTVYDKLSLSKMGEHQTLQLDKIVTFNLKGNYLQC